MNVFQVLDKEHQEIRTLFDTVLSQDKVSRSQLHLLCFKLMTDMEAKEKFLYPVLEQNGGTGMFKMEHEAAKKIIESLQKPDIGDLEIKTKLQMMKIPGDLYAEQLEHATEKQAHEALTPEQLEQIGQQIEQYQVSKMSGYTPERSPASIS